MRALAIATFAAAALAASAAAVQRQTRTTDDADLAHGNVDGTAAPVLVSDRPCQHPTWTHLDPDRPDGTFGWRICSDCDLEVDAPARVRVGLRLVSGGA